MNGLRGIFTAGIVFCLTANTMALELKGIRIPEHINQAVSRQQLILNGAGVRNELFIEVYIGALYLPQRSNDPEQIMSTDAAKRIAMHFLYDEISKDQVIDEWGVTLRKNLSDAKYAALEQRLDDFSAVFEDIAVGDVVMIDFLPDHSIWVSINGDPVGKIHGADFQQALLSVWLGDNPVDWSLKQAMLGRSP